MKKPRRQKKQKPVITITPSKESLNNMRKFYVWYGTGFFEWIASERIMKQLSEQFMKEMEQLK